MSGPKALRGPGAPAPQDPPAIPDPIGKLGATLANGVRPWMLDRVFTVQVVMWNPGEFPTEPEQYSHPLLVRIRRDGRIVAAPYGFGTGMSVWAETDVNEGGEPVIRFPFSIPGL